MERAQLKYLGYETALEGIAEKFHASPRLLRDLNRGKTFETGVTMVVPNVATETNRLYGRTATTSPGQIFNSSGPHLQ